MTHTPAAHIAATARWSKEVENIVVMERLRHYNDGNPCGAVALRRYLLETRLHPLPSVSQISRILTQYGLTYGRTGWYEGEEPEWLPDSAWVPPSQRKYFSMLDDLEIN
jgi:hypothetical protein